MQPASAADTANVTAGLWQRAAVHDPNDVFRVWRDGAWRAVACGEVASRVTDIAAGLIATGVAPGDRIALVGRPGLEWALAHLGVLAAGGVTVPVDADALPGVRDAAPRLHQVLVLAGGGVDAVAARAADAQRREVSARVGNTAADDVAFALYAADAAGVLHERSLTHWDLQALVRRTPTPLERRDTVLLCGSLATVNDQVLLLQSIAVGAAVAFPQGPETVLDDLQSFSPTVVSATADTFRQLVTVTRARPAGERSRTFDFAVTSAVQWAGREDPRTRDTIRRSIADKLVYRDLRDAMGGQVRHSVCSQGTVGREVAAVFAAADIPITPAHGLEAAPR